MVFQDPPDDFPKVGSSGERTLLLQWAFSSLGKKNIPFGIYHRDGRIVIGGGQSDVILLWFGHSLPRY